MSSSSFNDTAMTSSSPVTHDVDQVLRLSGVKTNSRYFGFRWKQRDSDEKNASRNLDCEDLSPENNSNSKNTNGFLKGIKKRLRIKNFRLCKVKQKLIGIDSQLDSVDTQAALNVEKSLPFADEKNPIQSNERLTSTESEVSLPNDTCSSDFDFPQCWASHRFIDSDLEYDDTLSNGYEIAKELGLEFRSLRKNYDRENRNEVQSTSERESLDTFDSSFGPICPSENKAKPNLSEELLKLSKYGWYWGPISGAEADSRLISQPDGAFLVRDSSDQRYLLTLSFKSSGRLLHARIEHSGGLFSLCSQRDKKEGFTSVTALIEHSMFSSKTAVFCYSRPKYPGYPSFPVRLTKPISRFTQIRSLQYLCRFVIRQNTRVDNIHKLPLPITIRQYIQEAHY